VGGGAVTRESALQREIQIAASAAGHRLFRINVALAWVGKIASKTHSRLVLDEYRPLHVGVAGMSDLLGWTGGPFPNGGRFAAIEVKVRPRKATTEQLAFIAAVIAAGGRACVAYSVEEALACLNG
jgi:hypothetical protein